MSLGTALESLKTAYAAMQEAALDAAEQPHMAQAGALAAYSVVCATLIDSLEDMER